ncbi:hypothetical protein JHK86_048042 [Glycine max]|nr:hypothetical protein JHK86_048042 [Glycine max]
MVVVDSDGDEMHVVCKQDQLKYRKADLKENLAYVMHNFKVIKNDGKFRDGDVDLNASPQALDRLLGCFLAFKVKVQPRFRNSVVLKYSDESELINVVLDMIPDSEQSVSVTEDHDPLLRIPLTPTTRVSSDELDNE